MYRIYKQLTIAMAVLRSQPKFIPGTLLSSEMSDDFLVILDVLNYSKALPQNDKKAYRKRGNLCSPFFLHKTEVIWQKQIFGAMVNAKHILEMIYFQMMETNIYIKIKKVKYIYAVNIIGNVVHVTRLSKQVRRYYEYR